MEAPESLHKLLDDTYKAGFDAGEVSGIVKGITIGTLSGYKQAVDEFKAAISDGTRRGSSKCAKELSEKYKKN